MTDQGVERVREYVRAGRNREWRDRSALLMRSKPLWQIAEELGMETDAVRSALLACGWYQAAMDAEQGQCVRKPGTTGKRYGPQGAAKADKTAPIVADPQGWDE
jgi:hypothetical protein